MWNFSALIADGPWLWGGLQWAWEHSVHSPPLTLLTSLTLPAAAKTIDSTQWSHLVVPTPLVTCDCVNSVVTFMVIMQGLADQ